ncbi:MAG: leucine-rich repeat domain-containing protein, partial [Chloroflexi bacterium]|nr:leucine-rich repeat domain-containing protein [Chloroflexota bacterium]
MRISRKFVTLAVLLSMLALLLPASIAAADQVVTFSDPDLEAVIREAIGKPTGDIYQSDLASLTILDAAVKDIQSLDGLQYCSGLTELYLQCNQISDVSPLQNLINLTRLELYGNQISDISPLQNLTSLTELLLLHN